MSRSPSIDRGAGEVGSPIDVPLRCCWALSCLLLFSCDGASPEVGRYTVRVDISALGADQEDVRAVESGVATSCADTEGRLFPAVAREPLSLPPNGSPTPLSLAEGTHAIVSRAIGQNCEVIASACLDIAITQGGSDDFVVPLAPHAPESLCRGEEVCVVGACVSFDAGMDAGTDANIDAWDLDPNCHIDCFGGRFCEDGEVREYANDPFPCAHRTCPYSVVGSCPDGCVARDEIDRGLPWTHLCVGQHPKEPGDPCTTDADCRPTRPTAEGRLYLRCSAELACEEVAPPEPPIGEPCDEALVVDASPSFGILEDSSCAGGVCAYGRSPGCLRHECTVVCEHDWDCPRGMVCGNTFTQFLRVDERHADPRPWVCREWELLESAACR